MRITSYFILVGAAALIFSASFSLMNTLGLINVQSNYGNFQAGQPQWQQMTDASHSPIPFVDVLTGIWNTITSIGYGLGKFLLGVVWTKGIVDQITQGAPPYGTFTDYLQGLIWTMYGIAGAGWYLGRATT